MTQTPDAPQQTPDLREYIAILRRRQATIIAVAALVVGSALGFSYLQTPQYTAQARVLVESLPTGSAAAPQPVAPVINLQTEKEIAASFPVAALVREQIGTNESTENLLDRLSVEGITETEVLVFSYTSTDPRESRDAANAFAEGYLEFRRSQARRSLMAATRSIRKSIDQLNEQITDLSTKITEARESEDEVRVTTLEAERNSAFARLGVQEQRLQDVQPDRLLSFGAGEVIEPALTPTEPSSPSYVKNGLLAAFLGLALGVGLAFLKERLDDRFRSRADVERSLEVHVLATIPRFTLQRPRSHPLAVVEEPHGTASEAYRGLRTKVQFFAQQHDVKSFLITSASAEEGKTVTACNLAAALAQTGKHVVLVSADLRRPTLERYYRVINRAGLTTWLTSRDGEVSKLVQNTWIKGVVVLPSGPHATNPAELLTSPRLPELIEVLEANSDIVLFDAPPALAVADAPILASQVGGTLLIVDAAKTHRSAALRAQEELERVGGRVVGAVLNAFDPSTAPYYYYEPYYESYRPASTKGGNGEPALEPWARLRNRFSSRR